VVCPSIPVKGCVQRLATDDVYIYEINPHVIEKAEQTRTLWQQQHPYRDPKDAPYPFRWDYSWRLVSDRIGFYPDHEPQNCYAKFHTVREAEDWLLAHGYKIRKFSVDPIEDVSWSELKHSDLYKTMPAKGPGNSPEESIAMIGIDYGDSYLHEIFYEYADRKAPFDFSRFAEENVDPDQQHEQCGIDLKGSYDTMHADLWKWIDIVWLRTGRLCNRAGYDLEYFKD
jgi:hypothetical protein